MGRGVGSILDPRISFHAQTSDVISVMQEHLVWEIMVPSGLSHYFSLASKAQAISELSKRGKQFSNSRLPMWINGSLQTPFLQDYTCQAPTDKPTQSVAWNLLKLSSLFSATQNQPTFHRFTRLASPGISSSFSVLALWKLSTTIMFLAQLWEKSEVEGGKWGRLSVKIPFPTLTEKILKSLGVSHSFF